VSKAPEPPSEPERDGLDWSIPAGGFDSYKAAAVHLRRPFTPEAVRFKVQATFGPKETPSGALIVSYIDARLAVERLNLVCPHLWSETFQGTSSPNFLLCRLTIDGITREDVGESAKGFSKDLVSDALKRAAVHFGVGVSLYAIPQIKLFKEHLENGNLKLTGQGKKSLVITDKGDALLRKGYARWLAEHGVQAFGPPLNHGDQEGHMDTPSAAVPESVSDPEADAKAADAAAAYQARVREQAA
jgi:hypothetical protein